MSTRNGTADEKEFIRLLTTAISTERQAQAQLQSLIGFGKKIGWTETECCRFVDALVPIKNAKETRLALRVIFADDKKRR